MNSQFSQEKYFYIKSEIYSEFSRKENELYMELKQDFLNPDVAMLHNHYMKLYQLEGKIRDFHEKHRNHTIEDFVKSKDSIDCMVLDVTHRMDLLSYLCGIQLLIVGVINTESYKTEYTSLLLSLMNHYLYRGDPIYSYYQWNLSSSLIH